MIISESVSLHNIIPPYSREFSSIFSSLKSKMHRLIRIAPVLLSVCLAGCFETSQTFTLNPDGSGKVAVETRFQTLSLGSDKLDDIQMKKEVRETLEKSQGVDAWRDVSYRIEPDGRIYFKGVAYFKNINDLDLDKGCDVRWNKAGDDMVLKFVNRNEEEDEPPSPKAVKLTDAEVQQRVRAMRDEWTHSKPLMESMMNTLKINAVFQLPGKVALVQNLKKVNDSTISFLLDGAKMVSAIDQLMSNDSWMKTKAKEGAFEAPEDGPPMGADVNELTFGQKGDVAAKVTGDLKPLFDYAAESTAAQADYKRVLDSLQ